MNATSLERTTTSGGSGIGGQRHVRAFSGGTPVTVDVEAQVRFRQDDARAHVVSSGVPMPRVRQILSVVLSLPSLARVEPHYLQVDVHRGDGGRYRHEYGLALVVAMASSLLRKPVDPSVLLLGDVDLRGNVRGVPSKLVDRLNAAIAAFEVETPVTVVCAPDSARWVNASSTVTVVPVPTLVTAVSALWPGQSLQPF